jgi:hypothetical protein
MPRMAQVEQRYCWKPSNYGTAQPPACALLYEQCQKLVSALFSPNAVKISLENGEVLTREKTPLASFSAHKVEPANDTGNDREH